jgi:hypothetical protein
MGVLEPASAVEIKHIAVCLVFAWMPTVSAAATVVAGGQIGGAGVGGTAIFIGSVAASVVLMAIVIAMCLPKDKSKSKAEGFSPNPGHKDDFRMEGDVPFEVRLCFLPPILLSPSVFRFPPKLLGLPLIG